MLALNAVERIVLKALIAQIADSKLRMHITQASVSLLFYAVNEYCTDRNCQQLPLARCQANSTVESTHAGACLHLSGSQLPGDSTCLWPQLKWWAATCIPPAAKQH